MRSGAGAKGARLLRGQAAPDDVRVIAAIRTAKDDQRSRPAARITLHLPAWRGRIKRIPRTLGERVDDVVIRREQLAVRAGIDGDRETVVELLVSPEPREGRDRLHVVGIEWREVPLRETIGRRTQARRGLEGDGREH